MMLYVKFHEQLLQGEERGDLEHLVLPFTYVANERQTFVSIFMGLSQAKDGDWFVLATNLAPCTGVRVHLWPASAKPGGLSDFEEAVEVTTKMAEIPAGPIQHQVSLSFFVKSWMESKQGSNVLVL